MALVVEDGSGLVNADAYLSVAEFKAYVLKNYSVTDPVTDEDIEQAIRRATRFIDGHYGSRFFGYRVESTQSLMWPRGGVWQFATTAFILEDDVVPQRVKDATAEAAIRELASPGSLTPDRVPSKQVLQRTVGPITTVYANVAATRPVVTVIDELLAPIVSGVGSSTQFLQRA